MVIYDQWSYMTMLGIFEMVFIALREGIKMGLSGIPNRLRGQNH